MPAGAHFLNIKTGFAYHNRRVFKGARGQGYAYRNVCFETHCNMKISIGMLDLLPPPSPVCWHSDETNPSSILAFCPPVTQTRNKSRFSPFLSLLTFFMWYAKLKLHFVASVTGHRGVTALWWPY